LIIFRGTLHRGKVCSFPISFFGRLGHVFFTRSKIHYFPNSIRLEARKFYFSLDFVIFGSLYIPIFGCYSHSRQFFKCYLWLIIKIKTSNLQTCRSLLHQATDRYQVTTDCASLRRRWLSSSRPVTPDRAKTSCLKVRIITW
jgi:hypothetical protein